MSPGASAPAVFPGPHRLQVQAAQRATRDREAALLSQLADAERGAEVLSGQLAAAQAETRAARAAASKVPSLESALAAAEAYAQGLAKEVAAAQAAADATRAELATTHVARDPAFQVRVGREHEPLAIPQYCGSAPLQALKAERDSLAHRLAAAETARSIAQGRITELSAGAEATASTSSTRVEEANVKAAQAASHVKRLQAELQEARQTHAEEMRLVLERHRAEMGAAKARAAEAERVADAAARAAKAVAAEAARAAEATRGSGAVLQPPAAS